MRIALAAAFVTGLGVPAFAQGAAETPAAPATPLATPLSTPPAADASAATGVTPVAPGSVERKEVTGAKPDPLLVVSCIQSDPPTGSRLGAHKTCHTQAQWNSIRANSAQDLMDMQTRHDNDMEGAALAQGR